MVRVSAAIILRDGLVLACRRRLPESVSGLWEFPGGKQESSESASQCIARECMEELSIQLRVGDVFATMDWPHAGRPMRFTFFLAEIEAGTPQPLVHDAIRWVEPDALDRLPFCPADAKIIAPLMTHLTGRNSAPS